MVLTTIPNIHLTSPIVEYRNNSFTVWDVKGHRDKRPLWQHYYENSEAVIFVVDSSDRVRVGEAKEELYTMLLDDRFERLPITGLLQEVLLTRRNDNFRELRGSGFYKLCRLSLGRGLGQA